MEQGIAGSKLSSARWSLSNISLKYRLPLLIGTLLAGIIIAYSWASYRAVKTSAFEVGRERLQNLTQQLSTLFQQSAINILTKTSTAANDAAIRAFVKSPETASRDDVQKLLQQFNAPQDPNSIRVEIWSAQRSLLFVSPSGDLTPLGDLTNDFKQASAEPLKTVGPFRQIKDTIGFPALAAVKGDDGKVAGYLVRWRKLAANTETRQQLTTLLGTSATLYLGNHDDDLWTDFSSIVAKPSVDVRAKQDILTYLRGGNTEVIGLARPIAGTPWLILIEFPDDVVLKPASGYVKRMLVIGLFVFAMGVAGTFVLSRNITGPLYQLTAGATAMSRGDHPRTVNIRQRDELGQLAKAFNLMLQKVGDSQRELERKVQERTAQLEEANRQLESLSQSHARKRSVAEKERTDALEALYNTEKQLVQSQKLEAVGRLAGGISHDFNNLLTVILGYSDITKRNLPEADPLRRNVEEIIKASERAASLTRQLLAFSRKQVMHPKVFDLNTVVSDLEKMLRRMIGEDIELRVTADSNLGNIKADPVQLEQVIMNLVVNARDAMPKGGKLSIETANVYLDESYSREHVSVIPGDYVMLAISDTGCGMEEETRQHIFEPFFTTKEQGKGTGLGLSMVYGIVKQSNGNIWVYSEEGHGTTFKIYLPRVTAAAEEYKRASTAFEVPGGSETILLVEDAEWVRTLARQVLETAGYRVLEAANGDAAVRLCESINGDRIDLLLTDVVMPGMSGNDMSRILLEKQPGMPVLYMSGYTDDAIVQHGVLEAGINFLEKPFTPAALALKVREVLDATETG
ncbi:MAG TPA: ATP-binding protein [Pyrinomonadaceae bacterium]|jgi:signal transduction histidine kinase/CheY-like chemotaxis protein|nr:ATP-binding protein [Pyrinomonadaceae bacterium]